ncbi:hypothetical protein M5X00_29955 [Paenibacillus alvei]|uniref:hypothetical protein n=1 Tax=Paenibacillus alvei TaxID=44250 RepID=UPI002280E195|nr:hypothetical protein [Paenibacillus alvei]MCY9758447.1 hypothetical protein [Paenibacillus alvei]
MIALLMVIVFLCLRIKAQDAMINDLTNKLMARNYTDYVTGTSARDAPTEEIHVRKPLSWYDDPNMPDGDKT